MKKRVLIYMFFLFFIAFGGCSTTYEAKARHSLNFINYNDLKFDERAPNHYIDLFFEGSPTVSYITLGRIDGFVANDEDINPLLKAKARQVGGDAVIDIKIDYQKEEIAPTVVLGVGHGHYYHSGLEPQAGVAMPYGSTESVKTYQISATVIRYAIKRALPAE